MGGRCGRGLAQCPLPAQAEGATQCAGRELREPAEFLLCQRRLPTVYDAGLGAFSRSQGLPERDRGSGDGAAGSDALAASDLDRAVGDLWPQTIGRWRRWWRERFAASGAWRAERGEFMPAVNDASLPGALKEGIRGIARARRGRLGTASMRHRRRRTKSEPLSPIVSPATDGRQSRWPGCRPESGGPGANLHNARLVRRFQRGQGYATFRTLTAGCNLRTPADNRSRRIDYPSGDFPSARTCA